MNSDVNVLLALATDKEGDTTEIEKIDEIIAKNLNGSIREWVVW